MATILQQIGAALGLGSSHQTQASGASAPAGTTHAAFTLDLHANVNGEQLLVANQNGATIIAATDKPAIIVGGAGNDHLTGGDHADVILGGGGTNVMTGGGGPDTFGHAAGARDVITDFSPAAGEHIALAAGLTLTGTVHGIANPAAFGLSGGVQLADILSFSDGSHVVLMGSTDTPTSDWFV